MDESVLQRLAAAVLLLRGKQNQRDFADRLGVAQSTVQSWENRKNTPSLENLEKIARLRGEQPEEFVAYLYGRSLTASAAVPIEAQIKVMTCQEVALITRAIADRLAGI